MGMGGNILCDSCSQNHCKSGEEKDESIDEVIVRAVLSGDIYLGNGKHDRARSIQSASLKTVLHEQLNGLNDKNNCLEANDTNHTTDENDKCDKGKEDDDEGDDEDNVINLIDDEEDEEDETKPSEEDEMQHKRIKTNHRG